MITSGVHAGHSASSSPAIRTYVIITGRTVITTRTSPSSQEFQVIFADTTGPGIGTCVLDVKNRVGIGATGGERPAHKPSSKHDGQLH